MFGKKLQDNKALLFIITSKFIESSLSYFLKWHTQLIDFFSAISLMIIFPFFLILLILVLGFAMVFLVPFSWFSKTIVNNSMH